MDTATSETVVYYEAKSDRFGMMNFKVLTFLMLLLVSATSYGQDTQYVKLTKGLVINYGEPSLNRLRYLKVAVDVRVPDAERAELVEYHRPVLLDTLVQLFAASEEETIRSGGGKEAIRQLALEQVQGIMKTEEGDSIIEDLLFSTFVVQR